MAESALKKFLGVLLLTGLAIGASCVLRSPTRPSKREIGRLGTDAVSVFFTGSELGALKPCGCSGGQLGGLDRRSAVFNAVPEPKRLIVDTGSLVKGDSEQDLIKFNIIVQAYELLGYDVVSLSEKDIEIGGNLGLLDGPGSAFGIISGRKPADTDLPARFTKSLSLDGGPVAVTVAAFDAKSAPIERVGELFTPQPNRRAVGILVLNNCDPGIIDYIAKRVPDVHCIVCPSESDEPMIIGEADRRPLVFSVGRFGRHVCELQIGAGGTGPKLSFRAIKVKEDLPQDTALVKLYEDYQQIVRERNLLEEYPRFVLPGGLEYTGSASCRHCHEYAYEKWGTGAHAHAFATLERVGSQYDPECVVCHVVGMEYESGYVSEQKSEHLKNVGCEICHGPGSEHINTVGKAKPADPKSTCLDCHTPDHSGDYAGNERQKLEKIEHWREPNAAGNVK
jgi:hypothetical protein